MPSTLQLPKNYLGTKVTEDPSTIKKTPMQTPPPPSTLKVVGNFETPAAGQTAPPEIDTTNPSTRDKFGNLVDNPNYQKPSLSSRYAGTSGTTTPADPLTKAREDLAAQLGQNTTPKSEQELRQQILTENQAYIDAVNKRYDELNRQDEAAGKVREDQTRSFNIRSGNIGSDFATSATEETKSANRKVIDANNAARNVELSAIYSKINESARKEAQDAKVLALTSADQRIKVLDEIKTSSLNQVMDAAKSGLPFESLKSTTLDSGESVYDYIARTTGKSGFELEYLYNQSLPKNQQREYDYKTIGNKVYALSINPATGKPEQQDLGIEVPPDYQFTIAPDGTPLVYNKADGTAKVAPGFGQGQFAKPERPTSGDQKNIDYQKAQQFIADNPTATADEVEQALRANTSLDDSDIKSLAQKRLTRAQVASAIDQKTLQEFFDSNYTEDEMEDLAAEAGYTRGGFLGVGVGKGGREDFIKSEAAKKMLIDKYIENYKLNGYTIID